VNVDRELLRGEDGAGCGGAALPHRRDLLLGGTALVVAAGIGLARWRDSGLVYRHLPTLPPFRELVSDGAISTASLPLAGLGDEAAPDVAARAVEVRADPCAALFGGPVLGSVLPIAYFSDFHCPYCRILESDLTDVLAADARLRLVRHELPLLGVASMSAAKAVLAAELQGGYEVMKARLLQAGLITDGVHLRAISGPLGLDGERLLRDMDSPHVADRLRTSLALGRVFGVLGTPALVIGRTLVLGAISARTIRTVVRDERAMPSPACASTA
jgi:predicted DsbA family dithiol-disulfide isomerase